MFAVYYLISKINIAVYLVNNKLWIISPLPLLKSERKGLTEKCIGMAHTLVRLKTTALYYYSRSNN